MPTRDEQFLGCESDGSIGYRFVLHFILAACERLSYHDTSELNANGTHPHLHALDG